ncbi:MAG TPA: amidase [Opitutae bacterium]|nr:amidase [Opitutae bacterium]
MNKNSIEHTQKSFITDSKQWARMIDKSLNECVDKTRSSVVSQLILDAKNSTDGPLKGVPFAVKDLFDVAGFPSQNSSVLPYFKACATQDSAIVRRMKELGASCVAKTQMNEFAYGLSGENPHFGNCQHPVLKNCLSGGSSSGSAHLVGAGYLPMSFGTDTGGSIRLPAAWCGLYGIRWAPGYFLEGAFPLAPSFDTMGWFTACSEDMVRTTKAWFSCATENPTLALEGCSILPKHLLELESFDRLSAVVAELKIEQLVNADVFEALLPKCQFAFDVLQSREAYSIHETLIEQHGKSYDPQVRDRILRAKEWTQEDISMAHLYRDQITNWFNNFFESYDFLVMPICPSPSVPIVDVRPELRERTLQLTTPASLSGLPALAVPIWLDDKRSIGLQFIFKNVEPAVPLALLKLCKNI